MKCRLGGPEGPFGRFGGGVNFLPLSSGIEPRMFDHATLNKVCDIWRIVVVVTCQRGTVAFTQIIIRQEKRRGYVWVRIVGLYGCGSCWNAKFLCCERNYFYSGLASRACNLFGSAVIARYVGCGRYRCIGQPCTEIDIDSTPSPRVWQNVTAVCPCTSQLSWKSSVLCTTPTIQWVPRIFSWVRRPERGAEYCLSW